MTMEKKIQEFGKINILGDNQYSGSADDVVGEFEGYF